MTQPTETTGRMKRSPDHEDEVLDVRGHRDPDRNRLTPVVQLPPKTALTVIDALVEAWSGPRTGRRGASRTAR